MVGSAKRIRHGPTDTRGCTGPGVPCPDCNRAEPPRLPADWKSFIRSTASSHDVPSTALAAAPFYAPNYKPPPRKREPGELLFSFRTADHRQVDCELRTHGEYGVEAQFFIDREFSRSRRFETRALAVMWGWSFERSNRASVILPRRSPRPVNSARFSESCRRQTRHVDPNDRRPRMRRRWAFFDRAEI